MESGGGKETETNGKGGIGIEAGQNDEEARGTKPRNGEYVEMQNSRSRAKRI